MNQTIRRRPTRDELSAAAGGMVADIIAPGLKILFYGINPGLYSAAIGHHFGRPGNRFWPTLFAAGITPTQLSPYDERELLEFGYGITNIVSRATAGAKEITREEMIAGGLELTAKALRYHPRVLAVLGVTAYRIALNHPSAQIGMQKEKIGDVTLWVLPNPSGLNAHYQLDKLATMFRGVKEFTDMYG